MHKDNNSLASLIERGGVYYNVKGANPKELITGLIQLLPPVYGTGTESLLEEILKREALVSTGIGRGIALPHPRNPLASPPLVAAAFPEQPLDWNTQDGSRVHTVFLIVSSSTKQHLEVLSKINFLCQQEKFYSLIYSRASQESIITAIREAETTWKRS